MKANTETDQNLGIFRKPTLEDGAQVWELVKSTGVLDLNSSYQYLMWCQYFSDTSVVVEQNGKIVGFISGFTNPKQTNTLFVWQVAVHESQRGKGLATKMLHYILDQDACKTINYVEATISPSNIPSQKLFQGLARDLNTDIKVSDCFKASDFPETGHEDEDSHLIGPFNQ
ncbi:MAG TPA: diaminobutyrate acetyltransferase [Candidatus Avamphibacillus intestinigallinarum]|nr:diaminobutyrate acetyltransferase [Candidatus Avamphibacillus intestinigallinarum]